MPKRKCPKKNKHCKLSTIFTNSKHYICTGIHNKPTMYKDDIVRLCLHGKFVDDFHMEMTYDEANVIGNLLLNI